MADCAGSPRKKTESGAKEDSGADRTRPNRSRAGKIAFPASERRPHKPDKNSKTSQWDSANPQTLPPSLSAHRPSSREEPKPEHYKGRCNGHCKGHKRALQRTQKGTEKGAAQQPPCRMKVRSNRFSKPARSNPTPANKFNDRVPATRTDSGGAISAPTDHHLGHLKGDICAVHPKSSHGLITRIPHQGSQSTLQTLP